MDSVVSGTCRLDCKIAWLPPHEGVLVPGCGKEIASSDRYRIAFVEGTASLEISRVDMSDAGNFTCEPTNSVGSKDCSGALIVQGWLETVPFSYVNDVQIKGIFLSMAHLLTL